MNRRGDVPTILLFVVAIVLAVSALAAFVSYSGDSGKTSEQINEVMFSAEFYENYVYAKAELIAEEAIEQGGTKEKYMEIAAREEEKFRFEEVGNFYGKIRNGNFTFEKEGEGYNLEIDGVFIAAKSGGNKVTRTFNVEVFNKPHT